MIRLKTALTMLAIGLVFSLFSASTQAALLTANDIGYYNSRGDHIAIAKSNMTGYAGAWDQLSYRSYYVFDLTRITSYITSASLQIFQNGGGYQSPDPSERMNLYDVATPVTQLKAGVGGAVAVYDDLGLGAVYGIGFIRPENDGTWITINLNSLGLAAVNNKRGQFFALGGALTSISRLGSLVNELVFTSGYQISDVRLNYTTQSVNGLPDGGDPTAGSAAAPEPGSIIGASLAILAALVARTRGRRDAR